MKRVVLIVSVILVMMVGFNSCGGYNNLVALDEGVAQSWANVETQYQRRADLIPNLVNTVKGYASHEKETLESVINARAKATSININPNELTSESMAAYQQAQGDVSSALGRLMVVAERYPDLKANQNFTELQAQLEGTENRIAVARENFNRTTREYNTIVRRFPTNIMASMFNFESKPYFESTATAAEAPVVQF
ncbi:MAG: LemA family protein [Rikenellaceae bacterium]